LASGGPTPKRSSELFDDTGRALHQGAWRISRFHLARTGSPSGIPRSAGHPPDARRRSSRPYSGDCSRQADPERVARDLEHAASGVDRPRPAARRAPSARRTRHRFPSSGRPHRSGLPPERASRARRQTRERLRRPNGMTVPSACPRNGNQPYVAPKTTGLRRTAHQDVSRLGSMFGRGANLREAWAPGFASLRW
jgi:hypothetical protein